MKKHPILGIMVRSDGLILIPASRGHKERWSYGTKDKDGYYKVCINLKRYYVHRLIAEAFIINSENKPVIDHIDRNPSNNDVANLRWVTVRENALNKKNNLIKGQKRGDISEKEYKSLLNKRWLEKNPDYYKTRKRIYRAKQKEIK